MKFIENSTEFNAFLYDYEKADEIISIPIPIDHKKHPIETKVSFVFFLIAPPLITVWRGSSLRHSQKQPKLAASTQSLRPSRSADMLPAVVLCDLTGVPLIPIKSPSNRTRST